MVQFKLQTVHEVVELPTPGRHETCWSCPQNWLAFSRGVYSNDVTYCNCGCIRYMFMPLSVGSLPEIPHVILSTNYMYLTYCRSRIHSSQPWVAKTSVLASFRGH